MGIFRRWVRGAAGKSSNVSDGRKREKKDSVVRITLPSPPHEMINEMLFLVSRDELAEMMAPLRRLLSEYKVKFGDGSDSTICKLAKSMVKEKSLSLMTNRDLAKVYNSFKMIPENIAAFTNTDSRMWQIWEQILMRDRITSDEISRLLGHELMRSRYDDCSTNCLVEIPFQHLVDNYKLCREADSPPTEFTLKPTVRSSLIQFFYGKEALSTQLADSLPEGLETVTFEDSLPTDISYLSAIRANGSILTSYGTIKPKKLDELRASLNLPGFPECGQKLAVDRLEMLATAYFTFAENKNTETASTLNPGAFARFIAEKYIRSIHKWKLRHLLPGFCGFDDIGMSDGDISFLINFINSLVRDASEEWLSISNLELRILTVPINAKKDRTFSVVSPFGKYRGQFRRKDKETGGDLDWFREVDIPYIVHLLKMLCSIGILELAMDKEAAMDAGDLLEGIRYIRTTSLGRYAYKIDSFYEYKAPTNISEVDVDERYRILTLVNEHSPFGFMLQKIATPIGGRRYRLTQKSILTGCDSETELRQNLQFLKGIMSKEQWEKLSHILDGFKDSVLCNVPFTNDYTIIKLKPGLDELTRVITTTREIRRNSLLAENGVILVKEKYLPRFKELLRRNGYIIK